MTALLLTSRPPGPHDDVVAALLPPDLDLAVVRGSSPLPPLGGVQAVLVDGAPSPREAAELTALREAVERGAALLALDAAPASTDGFWARLLGGTRRAGLPLGEYVVELAARHPLTVRLDPQLAVVDAITPLELHGRAEMVATVNAGFREQVVVATMPLGSGQVTVSGVGLPAAGTGPAGLTRLLRRALHPRPAAAPRSDLGLAVVGYGPYGGMGELHGRAAQAVPGLDLVAVVDPVPERRKAAEQEFPGVSAYADLDALLADTAVDVAVVATPPVTHADIAEQLLRAGKHVVCEKPLCLRVAEVDRLAAAAQAANRLVTVHQNRRYDPDYLALRRAVDGGLLGEVFNVETFVGTFAHPCRAWHSEVSVSGGAAYDWGSHHVDWLLQLLPGRPVRVSAHGHKRVWHDVTNLDQLRLHLTWADGREAEFVCSDVAAVPRPKFYVQGTEGTLTGHYRPVVSERVEPGRGYVREVSHHAEAPVELRLVRYESGYGLVESTLPVAPEQRHAFHRNLADHLHLGEPQEVTLEQARRVVQVLEAAQRATDEGRPVELTEDGR